jgi:hypothetical protein
VGYGQRTVDSGQETVGRQCKVEIKRWAVGSKQWAVKSGHGTVDSKHWAVGIRKWASPWGSKLPVDSGQRAVGTNGMAAFRYVVSPVLEFNFTKFRFREI